MIAKFPKTYIAILCALCTGALLAINFYSSKLISNASKTSSRSKKTSVMRVDLENIRYSMFPIYKNKAESFVYFHINDKKSETPLSDAKVTAEFIAKDGDVQEQTFKFDKDKRCFVTTLALNHHENYRVQTVVHLATGKIFRPVFSFHCADAWPEVEWLSSQETKSK
ncbi:hypothetical protein KF728_09650 [Candidatus Obscuribacterales bacterium]|nr:hypothetical protein [Candidatus Obscuribacterales bacterium]